MFEEFAAETITLDDGMTIFVRHGGSGPPVLLLHGFPETHLMWRDIAPRLARDLTVVAADLPGYGRSGARASAPDHGPHAKRAMALDLLAAMRALGHGAFAVVGHDHGGRVAYRLALDHPDAVRRLAVLDVVPTAEAWDRADSRMALAFWPWTLLAQPAPLPERLVAGDPDALVANAFDAWGSDPSAVPPDVRAAYVEALRDPAHAHAICEEYRAAATLDRVHDADDRAAGRRIDCPTLALWSREGGLAEWYETEGGSLGLWREWCREVSGGGVAGGHFFPEEHPDATADALRAFLVG